MRFRPRDAVVEDAADRLYLASREAVELSDALSVPRVAHIQVCSPSTPPRGDSDSIAMPLAAFAPLRKLDRRELHLTRHSTLARR